jgi:hypothetical protein
MRMRSPSSAPPVLRRDGSTDRLVVEIVQESRDEFVNQ